MPLYLLLYYTASQTRGNNNNKIPNGNNVVIVKIKVHKKAQVQESIPTAAPNSKTFQEDQNNNACKDEDGELWKVHLRRWFQLPRL